MEKTLTGAELIAQERQRQIEVEGWTPEHDDLHSHGEIAHAADCYVLNDDTDWPWAKEWWKPTTTIRGLVKAGGLYQAEIERLTRLKDKCAAEIDRLQNSQTPTT